MNHRFTLICVVLCSFAATAQADDAETWRSPLTLELQGGAFSPVGMIGGIATYTPHERITLMAGAGMTWNASLSGDDISWRAAVGVRHRAVYSLSNAFSMEYWISVGPWGTDPGSLNNRWKALVMLHVMPTWEYRHSSGFSFRMSVGVASNFYQRVSYVHTNTAGLIGRPICDRCNVDGRRYVIYPSTSVSLGYAF